MFNLPVVDEFAVRVDVEIPTRNPDRPIHGRFVAVFRYIPSEEFAEICDELRDGFVAGEQQGFNKRWVDFQRSVLDRVLVDIEGIAGPNGEDLDRNERIKRITDHMILRTAVFEQFFAAYPGAATKNSKTSPKR